MTKRIIILLLILSIGLSACGGGADQPADSQNSSDSSAADSAVSSSAVDAVQSTEQSAVEDVPVSADSAEQFIGQIKAGDFSNVTQADGAPLDETTAKLLDSAYRYADSNNIEWADYTLDKAGTRGLILLGEEVREGEEPKRIEGVFAVLDDGAKLILFPGHIQMTSTYFVSKNGNIIYTHSYNGTASHNQYYHCDFDENLGMREDNRLVVRKTFDWAIEDAKEIGIYETMLENNPDWAQAGTYYVREAETDEYLEEEQFLELFEAMTGYSFYGDNPVKPDWVDDPE